MHIKAKVLKLFLAPAWSAGGTLSSVFPLFIIIASESSSLLPNHVCQWSADCVIPNQTDICNSDSDIIDDEFHFLVACSRFNNTRRTFYSAIAAIVPDFEKMDDDKKFLTLLCPTNPKTVKIANRYIKFMFDQRNKLQIGKICIAFNNAWHLLYFTSLLICWELILYTSQHRPYYLHANKVKYKKKEKTKKKKKK